MTCIFCELIKNKNEKVLFEDDQVIAFLSSRPATEGHVLILPKEHKAIITEIDDKIIAKMHTVAKQLSSAVFDGLGAQGTNIIMQNGVSAGQTIPHFCINVIPRKQGDGLNFEWQPKPADEAKLSEIEQILLAEAANIEAPEATGSEIAGEDNYLIKQLHRIP